MYVLCLNILYRIFFKIFPPPLGSRPRRAQPRPRASSPGTLGRDRARSRCERCRPRWWSGRPGPGHTAIWNNICTSTFLCLPPKRSAAENQTIDFFMFFLSYNFGSQLPSWVVWWLVQAKQYIYIWVYAMLPLELKIFLDLLAVALTAPRFDVDVLLCVCCCVVILPEFVLGGPLLHSAHRLRSAPIALLLRPTRRIEIPGLELPRHWRTALGRVSSSAANL